MTYFTFTDAVICNKMRGLDKVIYTHSRLIDNLNAEEVPSWYPEDIKNVLPIELLDEIWSERKYEDIREIFLENWLELYSNPDEGEIITISKEDFLSRKAEKIIGGEE